VKPLIYLSKPRFVDSSSVLFYFKFKRQSSSLFVTRSAPIQSSQVSECIFEKRKTVSGCKLTILYAAVTMQIHTLTRRKA
jgi:hypothetical protein